MRTPTLILTLVLLTSAPLAPTALAQEVEHPDLLSLQEARTFITFTLQAMVPAAEDVPVPAVVTRLGEMPSLGQLGVQSHQRGLSRLEATFVFSSMASYVAWRESAETMELLRELENGSPQGLDARLALLRYPHVSVLREDG